MRSLVLPLLVIASSVYPASSSAVKKIASGAQNDFITDFNGADDAGENSHVQYLYDVVPNTHEHPLENNKIIKIKVALYMESLCPGCHDFIQSQLYPVFMNYSKYIQLDLVPYGNAEHSQNSSGQYQFECQHGEPECLGNIYLACVTHHLQETRPKHVMRYYNCLARSSSFSIAKDVKDCAKEANVNLQKLETCVKTKGPQILAHYGDRTNALSGRDAVPAVVLDDVFDIDGQGDILSDLFGSLCKKFKGSKPKTCST